MKKALIVIVIIIIVVAILIGVMFLMGQKGGPSAGGGPGTIPSSTGMPTGVYSSSSVSAGTPPSATSSQTITLGTSEGNVTMNNFYSSAAYTTQDGQTVALQDQADYSIVYNVSDSSFIISILRTPLETNRQAAESAFLSQLGISKTDACKLKVSEGVPISVSDQYPGVNFPLSFCGNSTPM